MDTSLLGFISLSETNGKILAESRSLISPSPTHPFLIAELAKQRRLVLVTHSSKRASELASELSSLMGDVIEFPAWETLPHEKLSPNSDTVAKRIGALYNLEKARVVIVPIRALVQPINSDVIKNPPLEIKVKSELGFDLLIRELIKLAYLRVDLVERRGEFAVRGGIIDIFPPDSDYPVRLDFFGDELEEIRKFEVGSQRTYGESADALNLLPCRELLIDDEVIERAESLRTKYPEMIELLNKITQGVYAEGMESLIGALHPEMKQFLEFLPNDFEVVLIEEERIRNRNLDLIKTSEEFLEAAWSNSAQGSGAPLKSELQRGGYLTLGEVAERAEELGINWRSINLFGDVDDPAIEQFGEISPYRGDIERLMVDLKAWLASGHLVALTFRGHGLAERYHQLLSEADIPARIAKRLERNLSRTTVYLLTANFSSGF
ncbi:MAG: transcription-repair coupling factor, partial [Actinomycetota bacterium]